MLQRVSIALIVSCSLLGLTTVVRAEPKDPKIKLAAQRGLDWLVGEQHRSGYWEANQGQYRVAMTALAANAMLCEGSTTPTGTAFRCCSCHRFTARKKMPSDARS